MLFRSDQLARVVLGIIKTQRTKNLAGKKWTILDIGCANGENLIALQRKLSKEIDIQAIGWDISPYAVEQATLHCRENRLDPTQVRFEVVDILGGKQGTPSGEQVRDDAHRAEPVADIVMNSLFLHHFEVPDIIRILKKSVALSRVAVIADDLERSRVGWLLAKIGCHVLSRSPVVHFDGPQSVRAAFTAEEMRQLAEEAGLKSISIVRHWPAQIGRAHV